jgi:choline dehydrogenase-like flavoprotein
VNLGLCNYGCPSNAKQSTLVTYVPRAERAGARVLSGTRVERVVVESGVVRGVDAVGADGRRVAVEAPLVAVAAGVLETPALLLRSGIRGRAGQGLQFHSSVHVTARFEEPVHGYYGPTMAYAVDELSDVNGHRGPGAMIESVTVQPIVTASALPGFGAAHAEVMAALPHLARSLVVIHDRTRGTMSEDGAVRYELLVEDVERLRAGMIGAASCYLNAGAEAVVLPIHGTAPIRRETELAAMMKMPLRPSDLAILYAVHLFGGAAMGGSPEQGVCDEAGRVFGVRGAARRRRVEPAVGDRRQPADHDHGERAPHRRGSGARLTRRHEIVLTGRDAWDTVPSRSWAIWPDVSTRSAAGPASARRSRACST